jgi:hypothetical protein
MLPALTRLKGNAQNGNDMTSVSLTLFRTAHAKIKVKQQNKPPAVQRGYEFRINRRRYG